MSGTLTAINGNGTQVLFPANTPYTVPRSLTSLRYTISPPFVEQQKAIKNPMEVAGFERAYLRDGAAMVQWYAWLDEKIGRGYEITEYQASQRLTEFRSRYELYWGLAYENISASGPNAGGWYFSAGDCSDCVWRTSWQHFPIIRLLGTIPG